MRRGLVVGKFAPLHRGHQHLLETAERAVDEVVVVVYETSWYKPDADIRAGWIRTLHPGVRVVVLPDLDVAEDEEPAAYARQIRAELGDFTDVFTGDDYDDGFARALGATHTSVARLHSGTLIRSDPFDHRASVDPLVYAALVRKVVFLGAESTGKTTLARELAVRRDTAWLPEYGRELWAARNGRLEFDELEAIAKEHLRREAELLADAREWLFCDTNALTTELWSRRLFGRASDGLVELAARTAHDYVTFLCEDDFDFVQDGTRETPEARRAFQQLVRADLDRRRVGYVTLTGTLDKRLDEVEQTLDQIGWKSRPLSSLG